MSIQTSSMPLTENDKLIRSENSKNYLEIMYPWDLAQLLAIFNTDKEVILDVARLPEAKDLVLKRSKRKFRFKRQFKQFCEEQGLKVNKCWE